MATAANEPGASVEGTRSSDVLSVGTAGRPGLLPREVKVSLAVHSALGVVIAVHSLHNLFWNANWGTRGSTWAAGLGAVFVWASGINGALFLNHNVTMVVFLLARSPEADRSASAAGTRPN